MRHRAFYAITLPFTQVRAELKDIVVFRQPIESLHLRQQFGCEGATTSPGFKNVTATEFIEHLPALVCDAVRKDVAEFRCRNKISRSTKLGCASAVVAQAGGIKCELHKSRETHRTT